jgi:cell division protein FtsI (penicillin-binding protein 3)
MSNGGGRLYWLDAPAEPHQRSGQRYSDVRRGNAAPRRGSKPAGRRPAQPSQPRSAPAGRKPSTPTGKRTSKPSRTAPSDSRKPAPRQQPARHHAARKNVKQRVLADKSPRSPRPSRFGIGQARSRLLVLVVALLIVLALVLLKVAKLQTTGGDALRMQGAEMWSRTTVLSADRGSIFDRNGEELAVSIPAATISVNPKLIDNPDEVVVVLQQLLGFDEARAAELRTRIAAQDTGFLYIARQVNPVIGEQLAEMELPGVNVDEEDRRVLPGGDTGRSVIGMTDIDGIGIGGLELQYGGGAAAVEQGFTDILTGTPGEASREVDQDGRSIAGTEQVTQAPVPGQDLVLTIDRSIQFAAEQALIRQVTGIGAKAGQAIVMDTDTGEVLAMASVLLDSESGEVRVTSRNSAVVDAYEPGSVAKVITMAAALNEGGVTPTTSFVVPWRKQYADDLLSDSHQHPDENMSVQQILVESSNIGTIMVKESIVADAVESRRVHWEYMRRFGLGEPTALNMPGESSGIMKNYDELWGSERATVAYGQGVSSTAIQLAAAINAIANDGMYVAPRLVQATVGPDGTIVDAQPSATHEVIGPEAAAQMQHMMRAVVCDPNGTGDAAQAGIENFSVAGKTGTGYKPQANGTYFNEAGERAYYSSFVGFFPAEDPQVTVLVSIDEPPPESMARFGSTAAAPVFAELAPVIMHERGMVPHAGTMSCDEFNTLPPGGY